MKWAFLGPQGTFTEEAARQLAGATAELVPCASIPDVLEAVALQQVEKGVVPLENSIQGSVHVTLDAILSQAELSVQQELVLAVHQNLLASEHATLSDIKEVWSHPQALAQCRAFLKQLGVHQVTFDSTAQAAAAVQKTARRDVAAIGTIKAAERFHLKVLQHNVQDVQHNDTRFVVVGRNGSGVAEGHKTMIVISPCREQAGVLASLLNVFAALHLNLSWIESRPTRARLGAYQFFMDIDAGAQTDEVQMALNVIRAYGHGVRVLGSYSSYTNSPLDSGPEEVD